MDTEDIKQGNQIINEFLGLKPHWLFKTYKDFSKDWNLLMELRDKVELIERGRGSNLYSIAIEGEYCTVYEFPPNTAYDGKDKVAFELQGSTRKNALFSTLVKLIKMHNEIKNNVKQVA